MENNIIEDNILSVNTQNSRMKIISIEGNEKQETREGKNLYNVYDTEGRNFNSTLLKIDDEDKISLEDYTNSSDVTKWIDFNTNISSKIKASTVYYVVTEIFSVSGSGNLTVVSTNASIPGQFATSVSYNFSALAAGDVKIAQITSREDLSNCVSMLRSFLQFSAGQGGSISFRVSVLEKSVTAEDFKYEKYGESPSFYYPSEIKAVENNINLKICNKNLNDNDYEIGGISSETGLNQNNPNAIRSRKYLRFDKGSYMISTHKFSGITYLNTALRLYDKNKKYLKNLYIGRVEANDIEFEIEEGVCFGRLIHLAGEPVSSDFSIEVQIEKGESKTDYIAHEEQNYVIPVQQKMLKGDKFIKINGKRKEQHTWLELVFDGVNRQFNNEGTGTSGKNRLIYHITEKVKNCNTTNKIIAYCSNSKLIAEGATYSCNIGFTVANNTIYMYVDGREASEINAELQDNPITFYIPLQEDSYQYLDCTEEQTEILDRIFYLYNGISNIYSEDDLSPTIEIEIKKIVEDYDAYISNTGYLIIPEYDIKYLVDFNESNIPSMPEATETSIKIAGRDGDVSLNTTYEPILFDLVCYTEDNLTPTEKTENETKINLFLNSIKYKTKKFAIEKDMKFYDIKYNGSLTRTNYPAHLKFSIPFKSSESYAKDLKDKMIIGNSTEESNTISSVGALFTIRGPATMPIISLNDYSMEYNTSILEGARIEIDSNKSTITHINSDGVKTNVMKYYNHQFPKIQNGINTLKILSGIDNDKNVIVTWNDLKL